MRGYFDDEEPEPEEPRRDTEVTLGAAALIGIVTCLMLICGVCFGVGYTLGKHSSAHAAAAAQAATQTAAPDQEPLQGSSSTPKPSAAEQSPAPAPAPPDEGPQPSAPNAGESPAATQPSPAQPVQQATLPPATSAPVPVRPAMPSMERTPQPSPAANVHEALPAQTQLMVQIAAVANAADAEVLVNALRKRNYSATARRDPYDGLIHVRIGPFTSREEAIRWRDRLLGDGYNAVIQQ